MYEKINDDRILPDRFVVPWVRNVSSYCEEMEVTRADSGGGGVRGYETNKPVRDIETDLEKIKKRTASVDRDKTMRRVEKAAQVFDGLLPVEPGLTGSMYSDGITNKAVLLMGMEELFYQMAACPEAVHRLFGQLADDNMALGAWEEEQGLLTLNNDGNQGYCSGSSLYSDEIPGRETAQGEKLRSADRYGYLEAQEATGISPDMFDEFIMPHYRRLAKKFKLMKFGCCEAVHDLMPLLHQLNGLRKVSVSPWCDLKKLAEVCRSDVIWSRKPVPLKLVGERFDPEEFKAHLQETLDIGSNHFIEFIFRDTCLLSGAMEKRIAQACDIVRELTENGL
jgi:hypothetical protein